MTIGYHHLKLPSERSQFKNVKESYRTDIAPFLESLEQSRKTSVGGAAGIVAFTILFAIVFVAAGPFERANAHVAILVGFAGSAAAGYLLSNFKQTVNDGLMARICQSLEYDYEPKLTRPSFVETYLRLKLLPRFNHEEWEDAVKGSYEGTNFSLCEANLKFETKGKKNQTRTVFHGQLLIIDYPKEFFGETIIRRDAGILNRLTKPGREFANVGFASPIFEKAFEAWSTDQVEARTLLDPIVVERFQELDRLFKGAKLRAAFVDGKLMITIETGDKLNAGSMFKPLDRPDRVETILKEFDLIFDLIDVITASIDRKIDEPVSIDNLRRSN